MKKQDGFSAVEGLLILVIIGVISGFGYFVYRAKPKTVEQASSTDTYQAQTTPKEGYKRFTMDIGKFTFDFPSTWHIYSNGIDIMENPKSSEPEVCLFSNKRTEYTNNFGMCIAATDNRLYESHRSFDEYTNGTIQELANGIEVWEQKKNIVMATGAETVDCPTIGVTSNKKFGILLSNNKYLNFTGSYCWGQDVSTTYTYEQIKVSNEYKEALKTLSSIQFKK
jgi:hypothetical protein